VAYSINGLSAPINHLKHRYTARNNWAVNQDDDVGLGGMWSGHIGSAYVIDASLPAGTSRL
jgi:hypothetical protein